MNRLKIVGNAQPILNERLLLNQRLDQQVLREPNTVLKDRRQFPRSVINRVAKYHSGIGSLPRECMVTDISERGARLYSDIDMPETFTLSLSAGGTEMRKECRVVWRLGGELGVEFTGLTSR